MPYKYSGSESITTTTSIGVNAKGNTYKTSSSTSTETVSRRKLTRGEAAAGILTTIGQLEMIGITILVLAVGSAIDDFTITHLQETNPNYLNANTYIPIEDPLNNVNYQQYGEDVFGRFFDEQTGFIQVLNDIGTVGKNVSTCLRDIVGCINGANDLQDVYEDDMLNPQVGSFIDEFGLERFQTLSIMASSQIGGQQTPYAIYLAMTTDERQYVEDTTTYSLVEENLFLNYQPSAFYIFGFDNPFTEQWQWGYYQWPSIRQTILNLGV